MEITLEQVEQLKAKANVSYAQAKQALEYSGGNLLDALIYLEEGGAISRPKNTYHSTKTDTPPSQATVLVTHAAATEPEKEKFSFKTFFHRVRLWLVDNELEVWRRDEPVTSLPVLILILLMVFAFYVIIPLLIVGLFFGFRYRFSGPDLERDSINNVIRNVADTAEDLGRQIMDELRNQHDKKNDDEK